MKGDIDGVSAAQGRLAEKMNSWQKAIFAIQKVHRTRNPSSKVDARPWKRGNVQVIMPTSIGRTDVLRCAKEFGLKARAVTTHWTRLPRISLPAIGEDREGRFFLLAKVVDRVR